MNIDADDWRILLDGAERVLRESVGQPPGGLEDTGSEALRRLGASFVTLKHAEQLRGCIGSLTAQRMLLEDVRHNARAAAHHDPRFAPLTFEEIAGLTVSVTVLGELEDIAVEDEAQLLARLCPFEDGLVLSLGRHRATFLPAVWAQLPEPKDFLTHLRLKAGLPADAWSEAMRFQRYGVETRERSLDGVSLTGD